MVCEVLASLYGQLISVYVPEQDNKKRCVADCVSFLAQNLTLVPAATVVGSAAAKGLHPSVGVWHISHNQGGSVGGDEPVGAAWRRLRVEERMSNLVVPVKLRGDVLKLRVDSLSSNSMLLRAKVDTLHHVLYLVETEGEFNPSWGW